MPMTSTDFSTSTSSFAYVETDVPEDMTLAEWRRSRAVAQRPGPARARRRPRWGRRRPVSGA
jgi:hypothetical protein